MLILPTPYEPKIFSPLARRDWYGVSAAQPKDMFGNPNLRLVRIAAKTQDGVTVWVGWFEDHDDADAFLTAIALHQIDGQPVPRSLWDLPQKFHWNGFPEWFACRRFWSDWTPDLADMLYAADNVDTLTSSPGSLLSYSKPSTFNDAKNNIQAVAGGGSGGSARAAGNPHNANGGGGGEWAQNVNRTLSSSTSYEIGATVAGVLATNGSKSGGNTGKDSWFDGATAGVATLRAIGGDSGGSSITGTTAASSGGTSGVGDNTNDGGGSGSTTGTATGGGGAAGNPTGPGNGGVSAGTGGVGGTNDLAPGFDSGDGGAGGAPGSAGGNYGGAGGGSAAANGGAATSGGGAQGGVFVTWTPALSAMFMLMNRMN